MPSEKNYSMQLINIYETGAPYVSWTECIGHSTTAIRIDCNPIRNFLGNIQGLRWAGLQCLVRFLWDWPTHYRGLKSVICRVYWGKLPTMRPTIYSSFWWDNPTSSPNNVGTSHALPRSFPTIYPGYNNGVSTENPLLFLNKQIRL